MSVTKTRDALYCRYCCPLIKETILILTLGALHAVRSADSQSAAQITSSQRCLVLKSYAISTIQPTQEQQHQGMSTVIYHANIITYYFL